MKPYSILSNLVVTLIFILLAGCNLLGSQAGNEEGNQQTAPTESNNQPYPIDSTESEDAEFSNNSHYPLPATRETSEESAQIPIIIPTPSSKTGVITGKLLSGVSDPQPFITDLYLGHAIQPDQPGYDPIISFSEDSDPKADQDPITGEFVLSGIEPGTYALVIWTPVASTVIRDQNTGGFLLFEVEEGTLIDLGDIIIP